MVDNCPTCGARLIPKVETVPVGSGSVPERHVVAERWWECAEHGRVVDAPDFSLKEPITPENLWFYEDKPSPDEPDA